MTPPGRWIRRHAVRTPLRWTGGGVTASDRQEAAPAAAAGKQRHPQTTPSTGGPQHHGHRPPAIRDRHPPALHHRRRAPLRRGGLGAARRPHHELPGRHRGLRAARRRGARVLERERHQHPGAEVLPGDPRHRRARVVAAPGGRPGGRHADGVGDQGRLLRRRRGGPRLQPRAQVPHHPPEGRVQLAGVVQHRRAGRAAAGVSAASSCRSRTRWTRSSTGTPRRASSSRVARVPASTCRASARRTSC